MDQLSLSGLAPATRKSSASSLLQSGEKSSDALANIAAKRGRDTIKLTYVMLRTRLARDLDQTLAEHLQSYPEMKDDFFIGIITDGKLGVEVVPKQEAEEAIAALPQERQKELGSDPIAYFSRNEFPLTTPSDERYQEFQGKLTQYFKRNADVIAYLRDQPEAAVDPSTLYTPVE